MTKRKCFGLTVLAMIAFASNSLLCRAALRPFGDPASFTLMRLASGAVCLWIIVRTTKGPLRNGDGSWLSALALFGYAALFSFAYLFLSAGTGALLLFAAVQATMIIWALRKGERMRLSQIGGLGLALAGLVALLFPGLTASPLIPALMMICAGIAWGIYSLRGKGAGDPLRTTAGNFVRAIPMALLLSSMFGPLFNSDDWAAAIYAIISGAFASGLGYAIWYTALPALKAVGAGTVQLSVPVIAAAGGILFLGEPITLRFALATAAVLGGIALVIVEGKAAVS